MTFRGDSIPIGTRVRVIDSGKSIDGQDGCSEIFDYGVTNVGVFGTITDEENQDGVSTNNPGINICVDGDSIWRIHPNSQLEILELPSKYWIENDGNSKEFAKLFNEVYHDYIEASRKYYGILDGNPTGDYVDHILNNSHWPVYTFEQWKSVIMKSKKEVNSNIELKGNDWVVVRDTPNIKSWSNWREAIGKVIQINESEAFKLNMGQQTSIGSNTYRINYYSTDLRLALPSEIPNKQTLSKKSTDSDETNSNWKLGDVLTSDWLNSGITIYEKVDGEFLVYSNEARASCFTGNRKVYYLENGFAEISGTRDLYLNHKKHYPTYKNNSNNQSQLKTQENEKINSSSRSTVENRKSEGISVYLPGDQEGISQGQRRKGTAVRG
jgi:hypothetical protein